MKTVKLFFAIVILGGAAAYAYYLQGDYSDGNRAGTVIKLSRRGLIFKTNEGQLNLGMILSDGPAAVSHNPVEVSNIWAFSVAGSDSLVVRQLDSAMMTGKRAKLHYREKFAKVPWRGETKYMVYKVELSP